MEVMKTKTSKHTSAPKIKPEIVSKHAKILGKLGGRPKKETNGAQNRY